MATKKKAPVKKAAAPIVRKPKAPAVTIIEFGEETKDLLRKLIGVLKPQEVMNVKEAATVFIEKGLGKGKATKEALEEVAEKEEVEEAEVSLSEIRVMIQEKASGGKADAVLKALKKYGATNATTLDESDYAAFFTDLKKI